MILKSRKNSKGENPIYLNVTIDGRRMEKSLNRSIASKQWDRNKHRGKVTREYIRQLNPFLNAIEHEIFIKRQELLYHTTQQNYL